MKTRLKKWLIRGAAVCVILFLAGYCFRNFWLKQIRIYGIGFLEIRAEEFGYRLPEVDEIELIALGEQDSSTPIVPDRIDGYAIADRKTLRGEDAEKVTYLWRRLRRGRGYSGMCHDPAYGLRFRQHGKLIFETTVCWDCQNYTLPLGIFGSTEYGFDAKSENAQRLLELLEYYVPLPEKAAARHAAHQGSEDSP